MNIAAAANSNNASSLLPANRVNGTAASGSTASTASTGSTASTTATNSLTSLASNFQDFLSMLMTQLKNQDPSSPMDTNQFTSELVEFASVQQQINTNASMTQLIQLGQSGQVLQSASIVGHKVALNSNSLVLQNGAGGINFTASAAGPVAIGIYGSNGAQLYSTTVNATQGSNSWSWNGQTSNGTQLPDGSYSVQVAAAGSGGTATAVPFTVQGTVTGVNQTANGLALQLGSTSVPFSDLSSLMN
jgi:flagellar basal-body rod modification protein FlgD